MFWPTFTGWRLVKVAWGLTQYSNPALTLDPIYRMTLSICMSPVPGLLWQRWDSEYSSSGGSHWWLAYIRRLLGSHFSFWETEPVSIARFFLQAELGLRTSELRGSAHALSRRPLPLHSLRQLPGICSGYLHERSDKFSAVSFTFHCPHSWVM